MPNCTNCNTTQSRLNNGSLCKACFNDRNKGSVKKKKDDEVFMSNLTVHPVISEMMSGDTPINELTVNGLSDLITRLLQPLQDDVITIKENMTNRLNAQDHRIKLLETDKVKSEEEIALLKSVICNMQNSLNRMDSESRKSNMIVTGLLEQDIVSDTGTITTDVGKVRYILGKIGDTTSVDSVDNWEITRIGKSRENYNRVVKIKTTSVEDRDRVLKLASKIKELPDSWKKVYIKKDLHPVYVKENQRIRKKRYDLIKRYENDQEVHDVKIINGCLEVDGVTIDRNLFFV